MMYFKCRNPLVIFLSALFLFSACKKDSDQDPEPTTEGLLYTLKGTYVSAGKTTTQLVTIDPADGKESVVATLSESEDFNMADMLYMAATNEVIGITDHGTKLLKINVTTKQTSSATLTTSDRILFKELVADSSGHLYVIKLDYTQGLEPSLVQVDYKTGNSTTVKNLESAELPQGVLYLAASNEVAMITGVGERLFKVNLATKDTSSVPLTNSQDVQFKELVVDNQSNLYGYRINYSAPNSDAQIFKLNAATGEQTLITATENDMMPDNFLFVPQRNEIITIRDETTLYRFNVSTKATSTLPLTSQATIGYWELAGK